MESGAPLFLAVGIAGMAGFIAASALVAVDKIGAWSYLGAAALSLTLYSASLIVGHLGDAFVLQRLIEHESNARERQRRYLHSDCSRRVNASRIATEGAPSSAASRYRLAKAAWPARPCRSASTADH